MRMIHATLETKLVTSSQLKLERRSVPRRAFGGVAEILVTHPAAYFVAPVSELSRFGCFLRTSKILPVGASLNLNITHNGAEYNTSGKVVHAVSGKGVGIMFTAADPGDEELLDSWLMEIMA
jgi:hypothetical protein